MTRKLNNIFLYLGLLGLVAYSSACSSTNAQSTKTTIEDKTEVSKPYKEPKRVSKDVISSDKKTADTKKK
jgi:hypothetical protein